MCQLNISVKNEYVFLNVKKKTIKYRVSKVLEKYTAIKQFDKQSGLLTLMAQMKCLDGIIIEEDWIDLNDNLGFAFKNPHTVINEIDQIVLM